MRLPARLSLIAATAALAVLPLTQPHAATPAEGTVSKAAPTFKWSGEAAGYGFTAINLANPTTPLFCEQPICDALVVKVAEAGGDLKFTVDDGNGFVEVNVMRPGGDWEYHNPATADKPTVVAVKNAPVGDYGLRILTNQTVVTGGAYTGVAALTFPNDSPAPAPGTTTPPTASPTPEPGGAPPAARQQPGKLPPSGPLTSDVAVDKGKRSTARTKGLRARLRCSVICRVAAVASVDKKTAKKLKLGSKTTVIGQGAARIDRPGRIPFFIKLSAKAKKALGKKVKGLSRVPVTVKFIVSDDQRGQVRQTTKKTTLR